MRGMEEELDDRVRWFNLQSNRGAGGAVPRNYALHNLVEANWVAYLDDDNAWKPNHLESMVKSIQRAPDATAHFSSFRVCADHNDDSGQILVSEQVVRGRIDTSCVVHHKDLLRKYGMWKDRKEGTAVPDSCPDAAGGYAHDYEFVSRWASEKVAFTFVPTVLYNTATNYQNFDSILHILGEPTDQVVLREKLGLRPLDEVLVDRAKDKEDPTDDKVEAMFV